jgi:type I restriction enzyme S subunit
MSWQTVKLGDACEVKRGTTITEKQAQVGNVPVVAGGLTYSYTHNAANRKGNVITVSGSGANAGYVNFWKQPIFASDCSTIQSFSDSVDIKFVLYFLKSKQQFINSALRSGAAQPHVYAKDIAQMVMPLPPLSEQKRIAAILDKAAEIKVKCEQALVKLDELALSTFVEMFGNGLLIFENWKIEKLGNQLEFITSGSRGWADYYADSGDVFLRIQNIGKNRLMLNDVAFVNAPDTAEARRTKVKEGDVLLSITADLGRTGVVTKNLEGAFVNQHLSILRTNKLNPNFLSAYLASAIGQQQVGARNKQGVKAGLNFDDIKSISVPVPPRQIQDKFATVLQKINENKSSVTEGLYKKIELIASLQNQAFTTGFSA